MPGEGIEIVLRPDDIGVVQARDDRRQRGRRYRTSSSAMTMRSCAAARKPVSTPRTLPLANASRSVSGRTCRTRRSRHSLMAANTGGGDPSTSTTSTWSVSAFTYRRNSSGGSRSERKGSTYETGSTALDGADHVPWHPCCTSHRRAFVMVLQGTANREKAGERLDLVAWSRLAEQAAARFGTPSTCRAGSPSSAWWKHKSDRSASCRSAHGSRSRRTRFPNLRANGSGRDAVSRWSAKRSSSRCAGSTVRPRSCW